MVLLGVNGFYWLTAQVNERKKKVLVVYSLLAISRSQTQYKGKYEIFIQLPYIPFLVINFEIVFFKSIGKHLLSSSNQQFTNHSDL